MDIVYYLLVLALIVLVPALTIFILVGLISPPVVNKHTKKDWSCGRITGIGVLALFMSILVFGTLINVTTPASVKADIEARQTAEAQAKASSEAEKVRLQQEAEKEQTAKEALPVIKTETLVVAVAFASLERTDANLPKGERKTVTNGVEGEQTETYEVTYVKDKVASKKLIKTEVTKIPVDQAVSVGSYVKPVQSSTQPSSSSSPSSSSGSSAYYANCTAARAAGVTPLYRGDPGYRSALDRDSDGIACE